MFGEEGTKIVIFNLASYREGVYELDLISDASDIKLLKEEESKDFISSSCINSLKDYCKYLYLGMI